MTQIELESRYVETEHGIFTPVYTYDEYIIDEKTGLGSYINLVIIKTARQVYDEWLYNKENPQPQEPDKISICLERLDLQEESTLDIDYRLTLMELGI